MLSTLRMTRASNRNVSKLYTKHQVVHKRIFVVSILHILLELFNPIPVCDIEITGKKDNKENNHKHGNCLCCPAHSQTGYPKNICSRGVPLVYCFTADGHSLLPRKKSFYLLWLCNISSDCL